MSDLDAIEILLVEDNPRDAELMMRTLKKNNFTNQLFHVKDGVEALDFLFARGPYQGRSSSKTLKIVFLDLKLPRLNGLEVLRAIKQDDMIHATPVVMVTSSSEDPDIRMAYEYGANSYVVKPVDFNAFAEAVSSLGLYWMLVNKPPVTIMPKP